MGDLFAGYGADDIRAGDVHLPCAFGHEDEVGDGGAVGAAAGARAHDDADLRDDTAGEGVHRENFAEAAEALRAILDASTARIDQADDWRACGHGQVHHFEDLLGDGFAEGAALHSEVVGEHERGTPFDLAPASDDSFDVAANCGAARLHEHIEFVERPWIEQQFDAFAGGELAAGVLCFDALFAASEGDLLLESEQLLELLLSSQLFCHWQSLEGKVRIGAKNPAEGWPGWEGRAGAHASTGIGHGRDARTAGDSATNGRGCVKGLIVVGESEA